MRFPSEICNDPAGISATEDCRITLRFLLGASFHSSNLSVPFILPPLSFKLKTPCSVFAPLSFVATFFNNCCPGVIVGVGVGVGRACCCTSPPQAARARRINKGKANKRDIYLLR